MERSPVTPRLPDAGWFPDPSRTDIERYWDGRSWTPRIRDRVSKLEWMPAPSYAYATTKPRRRTRAWARWTLMVVVVGAVWFVVAGDQGRLPSWVPYADVFARSEPVVPATAYPVFGSTDLVRYLAAEMVNQQESIDVTYWTSVEGVDMKGMTDALREATTQNPYVFADAWEVLNSAGSVAVEPVYAYDAQVAEGRREATAAAVTAGLSESGADNAVSPAAKVEAIHDFIAENASYDWEAYNEIGESAFAMSDRVHQSQEAYGILVAGTAVCNGYAHAFQAMAAAAGLESVVVTGSDSAGLTGGSHAWNLVRIDGEWKLVDVTWDDADAGGLRHDYLLVDPDAQLLASRTPDSDWIVDTQRPFYGG